MAQCLWCNSSGIFLRTRNGMCDNCYPPIVHEIVERKARLRPLLARLESVKTLETGLAKLHEIQSHINALLPYETRGIPIHGFSARELDAEIPKLRKTIVKTAIQSTYSETKAKVEGAATQKTKITAARKGMGELRRIAELAGDSLEISQAVSKIKRFCHALELNTFIQEAQKAELKGNLKKALDQYVEALFFLRADEYDDREQAEIIGKLESKITAIRNQLPAPRK